MRYLTIYLLCESDDPASSDLASYSGIADMHNLFITRRRQEYNALTIQSKSWVLTRAMYRMAVCRDHLLYIRVSVPVRGLA